MLFRTALIVSLSAPLLVNCSSVFKAVDGKSSDEQKEESRVVASGNVAAEFGNPVEEGPVSDQVDDCIPKPGYGQGPTGGAGDYPQKEEPTQGGGEQNQNQNQSPEEPAGEQPPAGDKPEGDGNGKDAPVEDCK